MNKTERNQQIQQSSASVSELAVQHGLSNSSIYRIRGNHQPAQLDPEQFQSPQDLQRMNRKLLFDQIGTTGLTRWGGSIEQEFQRELQGDGGINLYNQMSVHAVVSAVLFAIGMAQRQVEWFVEPASEDEADQKAAEFLEQNLDDMNQTLDDSISQIFTMLKFGYSIAEIIYKRRLGQDPPKYIPDPARSRFDDGLIGWRGWQFMSPQSLATGTQRWVFDEFGRVQAVRQQAPPEFELVTIPMEKALLFRTKVEWGNPEGFSILRPMYREWYYAVNLAEIEAIAAERLGSGVPVIYLGNGLDLRENADSDWAAAKDIVRNLRTDEQMGIVITHPKMGAGAPEGTGVLLELMSPPARGGVDYNQIIDRHEKRMAMTVLAQFIFLGMAQVGTQALNTSSTDTHQMSIGAWSDGVADVINRFAVPRLFALNPFTLEVLPKVAHSDVRVPNLVEMAEYINKLSGVQLITPTIELERHLRDIAGLPDMPEDAVEIAPRKPPERETDETEDKIEEQTRKAQDDEEVEDSAGFFTSDDAELIDDEFALRIRQGSPKWERATNQYELELRREYQAWSDSTAKELAEIDDDATFGERLREKVDELVAAFILIGRRNLPKAHDLGRGPDTAATPDGFMDVAAAITSNDAFVRDSLGPAIVEKVEQRTAGDREMRGDKESLGALFGTFLSRVGSYSGAFWGLIGRGVIDRIRQRDKPPRVRAILDRQAQHCRQCPIYARVYENMEELLAFTGGVPADWDSDCLDNCRCWLEEEVSPGVWRRI